MLALEPDQPEQRGQPPTPPDRPTAVGLDDGDDRFDAIFQALDRMDFATMTEFLRRMELRFGVRVR